MEKEDKKKSDVQRLISFLEKVPEEPQQNKKGDPQIISLKTALVGILAEIDSPKLMDFGCGKGTLIPILYEIPDFKDKNGVYIGVNEDKGEDLSNAFVKSDFYKNPGSQLLTYLDFLKIDKIDCNIIVVKNVIHEVQSIKELGEIIHKILKILKNNGRIVVQDIELLRDSELGNCPYMALDLKELFEENGLDCNVTSYESFSGVPLYTLIGKKMNEPNIAKAISDKLLSIRETELIPIKEKLYPQIKNKRTDDGFRCIMQHFDFVAIQKQISDYKGEISPISEFEGFKYHLTLNECNINSILENKPKILQEITWFHNRGVPFKVFTDEFLNTSKSVMFLFGPRTIGKTTFALQALKTRNPFRKPIYIKIPKNCDYWRFIENLFFEMKLNVSLDKLSKDNKHEITSFIVDFFSKFSEKVIFCFDDFENSLEYNLIADKDLQDFLSKFSKITGIKCLVVSNIRLNNVTEVFDNYCDHRLNLFPEDYHVIEVLDAVSGREHLQIEKYPTELISAIGRHPAIAYLVGENIKAYGSVDLVLENNIEAIKKRIIDSMLGNIDVTPSQKKILCTMSLFVAPESFEVIKKIIDDTKAFASLIEKGLIYFYGSNYFILETLKKHFQHVAKESEEYQEIVKKITDIYYNEFKNNKAHLKIRYYRNLIDFKLFKGETDLELDLDNEYYFSEISELAETYFYLDEYTEAKEIYEKLISLKKNQIKSQMRKGSCLIRLHDPVGEKYNEELINIFPNNPKIKSNYIDDLIYVNNYTYALAKLKEYFGENVSEYHPHQYGQRAKIEESFGNYPLAEEFYFKYLEEYFTINNLRLIIKMYDRWAKNEDALEIIEKYEPYFKNSRILKLEKGKILEKLGINGEAKSILEKLYAENHTNSHYLLPLIKILLKCSKENKIYLEKAKNLIKTGADSKPKYLYIQAKILIMIEQEDFPNIEKLLIHEFPDNKYRDDEYINGLKATIYLKKGIFYKKNNLPEYSAILRKALTYTDLGFSQSNVPLLMQRMDLLREMGETGLMEDIREKILEINPDIPIY